MTIKGIDIVFSPFSVQKIENATSIEKNFETLGEVSWCSLPDILYEPNTREFIGLSFAIDKGQEGIARDLVEISNPIYLEYVAVGNDAVIPRYTGFGQNDRLEVAWRIKTKIVECEFSSLFDGFWYKKKNDRPHLKNELTPFGYCLINIEEILSIHDLKFQDGNFKKA